MSEPEFPPELVFRCAKRAAMRFAVVDAAGDEHFKSWDAAVVAVLRESGHAELVAALKEALPYVKAPARFAIDKRAQAIAQECNSALSKAGAL